MSGGSSQPSNTTTTTKMEPPAEVKPYLAPFLDRANALANQPYQAYSGNRVAGFNADQNQGFGLTRNIAAQNQNTLGAAQQTVGNTSGGNFLTQNPYLLSGIRTASQQNLQDTLSGRFMGDSNPYMQGVIDRTLRDITRNFNEGTKAATDANFARAGAFGGSAWDQATQNNNRALADSLGAVAGNMRSQNYQTERQNQLQTAGNMQAQGQGLYDAERMRQMQAAMLTPQLNQASYGDARALLGIGDAQQSMTQQGLNNQYQQWLDRQNAPYRGLDTMSSALGTVMGAGGTNTQTGASPYQSNRTASALGGGLAGFQMGNMIMPGIGGLVGGGLGLIGGLF